MPEQGEVQELVFKCNSCGSTLNYEPGTTKLKCPHCGTEQAIAPVAKPIVEHDIAELEPVPYTSSQGFGAETRHFKCDRCGAITSLAQGQMATKCAFCDSPVVVETPPVPGMVMPESLVPFVVGREKAIQLFQGWLRGLWFRPSDLKKRAALAQIDGLYAPHFTFDANAFSRWSGYAGHYYYETEHYTAYENGKQVQRTRQVQKIRWEYRSGTHNAFYDDVLIDASKGLPREILMRIYPYNLKGGLVPYRPDYLSGYKAEAYSIDPRDCWQSARGEMQQGERNECSRLLDGDTQRDLNVSTDFSDIKWKHLLLPAYVASYQYGAKVFRFMVNGQSGKVQGEAPYSWLKIGATIAVIAIVIAGIAAAKYFGLF